MSSLSKTVSYDYKVLESGCIEARRITRIIEDDVVLSTSYHRLDGIITPGAPLPKELPENIKNGILTFWTQAVIDNYNATISG